MYGKPDSNHTHWIMKVRLIASEVAVNCLQCQKWRPHWYSILGLLVQGVYKL